MKNKKIAMKTYKMKIKSIFCGFWSLIIDYCLVIIDY
jgi:hypothetical protein